MHRFPRVARATLAMSDRPETGARKGFQRDSPNSPRRGTFLHCACPRIQGFLQLIIQPASAGFFFGGSGAFRLPEWCNSRMTVTLQRPSGHLRSLKLRVRAADSFFDLLRSRHLNRFDRTGWKRVPSVTPAARNLSRRMADADVQRSVGRDPRLSSIGSAARTARQGRDHSQQRQDSRQTSRHCSHAPSSQSSRRWLGRGQCARFQRTLLCNLTCVLRFFASPQANGRLGQGAAAGRPQWQVTPAAGPLRHRGGGHCRDQAGSVAGAKLAAAQGVMQATKKFVRDTSHLGKVFV